MNMVEQLNNIGERPAYEKKMMLMKDFLKDKRLRILTAKGKQTRSGVKIMLHFEDHVLFYPVNSTSVRMSNTNRSREPKQSISPNHKSVKVSVSTSELSEIMDARLKAFEDLILRRIEDAEVRLLGKFKVTLAALTCEVESLRQRVTDVSDKLGSVENQFSSLRGESESLTKKISNIESKYLSDLNSRVRKLENASVTCDVRISGIPHKEGENLNEMLWALCEATKTAVPKFKSIYRERPRLNRNDSPINA
uniref:Uncharacterized protein n=1 Tax=Glossina pallidipes TaxID=7398 RepID=A0A1B0A8L7_GLOPL